MIRRALLCSVAAMWSLPALGQNITCPTRPPGDSTNACASTQFVQQSGAGSAISALTGDVSATGPGSATATIQPGVVTSAKMAAGAASTNVGSLGGSLTGTLPNPTIAASAVTNSNLANMNALTMKANATGSSAAPQDVSATAWFDAAYCNTVGFLIVRFTGAWTCAKYIAANPVWWGADPTGASDSTSAFNSALSASNVVEFPAGTFKLNSGITYSLPNSLSSVTIKGQGADVTILTWPSGNGLTINYQNILNSSHIWDLSLTTGTTAAGPAIALTSTAAQGVAVSDIYRVSIHGSDGYNVTNYWSTGVADTGVSNLNIEGLIVNGVGTTGSGTQHGLGLTIVGETGSSVYAVQINVAKSFFQNVQTGIIFGSFVQGLTVDQTNFTLVISGIVSNASETGTLAQLSVTNSQFGLFNNTGSGIATFTQILQTQISNNYFVMNSSASGVNAIDLDHYNHCNVVGNQITSLATTNGLNGIFVGTAVSGGVCVISANDIFLYATGISLGASSVGVAVNGNTLEGNTTAITNSGTGNTGIDLPWVAFTPTFTCGTGTFTNNSARWRQAGKITAIEFDQTISAIGSCSGNNISFTLPNTPQSAGSIIGREVANSGYLFGCTVTAGGTTVLCSRFDASLTWAVNNRLQASGIYENQ